MSRPFAMTTLRSSTITHTNINTNTNTLISTGEERKTITLIWCLTRRIKVFVQLQYIRNQKTESMLCYSNILLTQKPKVCLCLFLHPFYLDMEDSYRYKKETSIFPLPIYCLAVTTPSTLLLTPMWRTMTTHTPMFTGNILWPNILDLKNVNEQTQT